mmetsp:Transcript_13656/g.18684  ORF Transcript_13656/g.18684 Transcript_13656/m.18684 type:complete len:311 (-) Transcript_13656:289-1221(-)
MRFVILILGFYFIYFELVSAFRDGVSYLKDVFNYFDFTIPILNWILILTTMYAHADKDQTITKEEMITHSSLDRFLAAITVSLMWFKAFYWMRLFSQTSFYIRLIIETLSDIKYFLILFIIILCTFGNAFLIIDIGREESFIQNYFSSEVVNVIFDQYLLSLGEFNGDGYMQPGADTAALVLFVAATFITQITFLNMLIAIMGDTFARVSEVRDQSALREKVEILADFVQAVPRAKSVNNDKYLFAIQPTNIGSDEQANWEGSVTSLKKNIECVREQLNASFTKKMRTVMGEVHSVNRSISVLEQRMSEQ